MTGNPLVVLGTNTFVKLNRNSSKDFGKKKWCFLKYLTVTKIYARITEITPHKHIEWITDNDLFQRSFRSIKYIYRY